MWRDNMYTDDAFFQILNISKFIQITSSTIYGIKINAKMNTNLLQWQTGKQLQKLVMFSQFF